MDSVNNAWSAAAGVLGLSIYAMIRLDAMEKRVSFLEQGKVPETVTKADEKAPIANPAVPAWRSMLLATATVFLIVLIMKLAENIGK